MAENQNPSSTNAQPPESPDDSANLDFIDQVLQEQAADFFEGLKKNNEALKDVQIEQTEVKLTRLDKITVSIRKFFWYFAQIFYQGFEFLKKRYQAFKALSGTEKKALIFATVGALIVVSYFGYIQRKHWLKDEPTQLFIPSFESWAKEKYFFDPVTDREPFYESLRVPKNLFNITKVYVNLKSDLRANARAMGAFEFVVEGSVPEVVVEIKSNEGKFIDLTQRVIESFSYEQLDTVGGKQELCENLRKEMNANVKEGLVRKVFLKNFILKP